jgi:hypothetical protein
VKQIELDKLQQQLESFGKTLTSVQCEEFRQILFSIGVLHNSVGDIYKYAELALIPSKISSENGGAINSLPQPVQTYKKKVDNLTDLTMTLARNLELNLKK